MLKRKLLSLLASTFLCAGACPPPSTADVAPDPMSGGITIDIPPGDTKTTIAMQKETVTLDVYPDRCVTSARFHMTNLGKPVSLEVGFPTQNLEGEDFGKFEAWVNGQGVRIKRKTLSKTLTEGLPGKIVNTKWIVWDMNFPFGETQYIDVTYENSPAVDGILNYGEGGIGSQKYDKLLKEIDQRHVDYVLYSGAYWKGPIGKCDIAVNFHPPLLANHVISSTPPITAKERSKVSWHFDNLYDKPQTKNALPGFRGLGVHLEYSAKKDLSGTIDATRKASANNPTDPYLVKFLVNCLLKTNANQKALEVYCKYFSTQSKYICKHFSKSGESNLIEKMLLETFELADKTKSPQTITANKIALKRLLTAFIKAGKAEKFPYDPKRHKAKLIKMQQLLTRCSK